MEEVSSSSAQRATLLFMEEGFEVIFCVLPMSSVGCPDVSDLGGGLGQAPQDGLAARWAGQVSVEADAFLHITVTREPPGQRLPSGHGVHGDRLQLQVHGVGDLHPALSELQQALDAVYTQLML